MNLGMIHVGSMYSMYSQHVATLAWNRKTSKILENHHKEIAMPQMLQPEPRDPEDFPSCQDMNNLCLCRGRGANSHPGSMKRSIQRHAAKKSLADIIRNAVQMEVGLGIKVVQRHGKLLSSTNNSTWSGFFCGNLWWLERTIGIVGIVLVCL